MKPFIKRRNRVTENKEKNKNHTKSRLRNFSDEVFRNYLVMRMRWKISALERQRTTEVRDLGNRVFRLYKRKELTVPGADSLLKTIEELEADIELQEEKLREIIMRADVSRQIPESTEPDPTPVVTAEKPIKPVKSSSGQNLPRKDDTGDNGSSDVESVVSEAMKGIRKTSTKPPKRKTTSTSTQKRKVSPGKEPAKKLDKQKKSDHK
jgi:hypothetical protein